MSSFEKLFAILTLLYTIIILLFYFVDSEELSLEDLESLVSDKYKIKLLINLHLILYMYMYSTVYKCKYVHVRVHEFSIKLDLIIMSVFLAGCHQSNRD